MLQATLIGHIGSDAEYKNENGREFVTFRVANTDRWKDEAGNLHEDTQWVDIIMSGKPAVLPYLKRGQMVFVTGPLRTRIYSSKKDRCMKAGITISARNVELIGGRSEDVPSVLYQPETGEEVKVTKWYFCEPMVRPNFQPEWLPLVSRSGGRFVVDRKGWVHPFVDDSQEGQPAEESQQQSYNQ